MARRFPTNFIWNPQLQQARRKSSNIVPITNRLPAPKSAEEEKATKPPPLLNLDDVTNRYSVCKGRTSSLRKFMQDKRNLNKKLAGLQDDYDILPPDEEPVKRAPPPPSKPARKYREFPASTTYKNVTLPLKSEKLASPFPDPVKLMPSHPISDQEKAAQMQAEFRIPKFISSHKKALN